MADAGPTGIEAVLAQFQDGVWRVISYASRNLTDVERRYSRLLLCGPVRDLICMFMIVTLNLKRTTNLSNAFTRAHPSRLQELRVGAPLVKLQLPSGLPPFKN